MMDAELEKQFAAELAALEQSGAVLPLSLKPAEAWYLLRFLQNALVRTSGVAPDVVAWAKGLAQNIEGRLCRTPAMQEVARRGWYVAHDLKRDDRATSPEGSPRPVAQSPPPEPPERARPVKPPPPKRRS